MLVYPVLCPACVFSVHVSEKEGGRKTLRGEDHPSNSLPGYTVLSVLSESLQKAQNRALWGQTPSLPIDQPQFQDCILMNEEYGNEKTAHTHREDHLQVVEHLNLLREAFAAPTHQVVLTVGRRMATRYCQGAQYSLSKNVHWALLCAQQHAGCWRHSSAWDRCGPSL